MEIPVNMASVTTTVTTKIGSVEQTFTTMLAVQTHKMDELATVTRLAWAETRKQADDKEGTPWKTDT